MKFSCLLALLCLTTASFAQDAAEKKFQEEAAKGKDTAAVFGWKLASLAGLNLSQVSFKDWAAGGENSLAYGFWATGGPSRPANTPLGEQHQGEFRTGPRRRPGTPQDRRRAAFRVATDLSAWAHD